VGERDAPYSIFVPGACCRGPAPPGPGKRGLRALPWFVPGVAMALLPKCPACLAAWLALATGAGVTATTASHLRVALVVAGVAAALYALIRLLRPARPRTAPP
jgi:hypothetical protein